MNQRPVTRQEAINILWNKGILHWKLHSGQKALYDSYKNESRFRTLVWACSRRLGKSFALCLLAIEKCLSKDNAIVKYVAPEQKQVRTIIMPIMREILKDCPKELQPKFMTQYNAYRFPNGSEIQMAGADNGNAENLRGGASDLCIIDEAGFCDDLDYVVQSILLPTTATTGGKILLASTPPKTMDHAFKNYIEKAQIRGTLVKKTVYDNPMLTPEAIQELMDEAGGATSISWRREYLCELIVDDKFAIVPEFTEELKARIVKEWKRPPFFDGYIAMDLGMNDYTFVLFGYYDFHSGKLIIEDELVMNGQKLSTASLAEGIKRKKAELWTDPLTSEIKEPSKQISDINPFVMKDLHQLHGLTFTPSPKDDAEAALNNMRLKLEQEKIIINPKCVHLINHLQFGIWNKQRTKFARSTDYGHYDGIDALKYLVRNLSWGKNPFPKNYDLNLRSDSAFYYKNQDSHLDIYKKIFNIKKR